MNILKVNSPETIDDIANRLYSMLGTIDPEVNDQVEVFAPYLSTCAERLTQRSPMAMLIPPEEIMAFAGVAMKLGYYLAKKPWELEAQLNELKATYGTVPYEEDNNGKIAS